MILCRNLVLTYFAESLQRQVLGQISARLQAGGALVIGQHEALPQGVAGFRPFFFVVNHAYFIVSEEPGLEKRFGDDYRRYKQHVPRWLPRRTPWTDPEAHEPN